MDSIPADQYGEFYEPLNDMTIMMENHRVTDNFTVDGNTYGFFMVATPKRLFTTKMLSPVPGSKVLATKTEALDLYSRRVIGWSMNERMTKLLACDAMQMAINQRTDIASVITHTDRASQYCSNKFQTMLKVNGIRSSMSKKGDCYDNASSESFFHTLKVEAIHGELFSTQQSMRETVERQSRSEIDPSLSLGNTSASDPDLEQGSARHLCSLVLSPDVRSSVAPRLSYSPTSSVLLTA